MHTETLIIGGGLSGLSLASELTKAGRDFHLVEARARLGGRILTEHVGGGSFDLGPAWFWPGQPRIAKLVSEFGLAVFEQYSDGILTYENERGQVERGQGYASMKGSYRLEGGLGVLIDALAAHLRKDRISLNAAVTKLEKTEDGVQATTARGAPFNAQQVVLALPPRLASNMTFQPSLPAQAHRSMDSIPTWMAGQAKAVAVYDTPFWRQNGLSGDAMSRHGPVIEVHDASPNTLEGPFALFGFIGVPPSMRNDQPALQDAILAQLARLFGPEALSPKSLLIKDWAFDPHTSTTTDQNPLSTHPRYGLPSELHTVWENRMIFAGTEVAPQFGGYLEGALEAAEAAFAQCVTEEVT